MQTLTVEILDTKAQRLLEDLELLQLIRLRNHQRKFPSIINWAGGFSSTEKKQSSAKIEVTLTDEGTII